MLEFYKVGEVVCAMIEADDNRSLQIAKKHRLTRANTCGSKIRHVGSVARFNLFLQETNI
jgi:hypothetical protein